MSAIQHTDISYGYKLLIGLMFSKKGRQPGA